jgi:hypothetical protein
VKISQRTTAARGPWQRIYDERLGDQARADDRAVAPDLRAVCSGSPAHPERHKLDLARLDLLAEELGRAPHHQAADEDGSRGFQVVKR